MRGLLLVAMVAAASSSASNANQPDSPNDSLKFTPVEFYSFELGGESGQYTAWEKRQISKFEGLSTTIDIQDVKGKPKDRWASIARINLYGEGDEKQRKVLSLTFTADRSTRRVEADIWRGGDTPHLPIGAELKVGKPISFGLYAIAASELALMIDGQTLGTTVKCEFDVKSIRIIGSGMDVRFSPFNLMKKSFASEKRQ
ncbi:MAG: hypothetical protein R3F08_12445 [Dokdonella sp.]|nr:hypothetical protein [Dokdonella sp.]